MTGEEFKKARQLKHLTQQRLGEMLGYKGRTAERMIQAWEYGERGIPAKYYRKLSEILEIPLEKFIP